MVKACFVPLLGVLLVLSVSRAGSAVLLLTDPSSIPVPPGTHVDSYGFPVSLLEPANPITSLEIDYDPSHAPPGNHDLVSGTLLFNPAQVLTFTPVRITPTDYEAIVQFSVGITEVSDESAPAFWAVHGEIGGGGLTELVWTATYLDGSQRSAVDGIIPEPSTGLLLAVAGVAGVAGSRRRRRD